MKKLIYAFLVLMSVTFIPTSASAADVLPDPTAINQVFPDPSMAEEVRAYLGKASTSDLVSQDELDTIRSLSPSGPIATLTGAKYLHNIGSLSSEANGTLSDLSELSGLKTLFYLAFEGNNITDISPISGLTALINLNLSNNNIKDFSPISNLPKLDALYLANTGMTNSDLSAISGETSITQLNLNENHISDISSLSGLTKLILIHVSSQTITQPAIPFSSVLTTENPVKTLDGSSLAPDTISNSGTYTAPNITWNLPVYVPSVNYTYLQDDQIGSLYVGLAGTITQPLVESFTATFDVDGKTTSSAVADGALIPKPQDPTKAGYTFNGWYTAKTGGDKWDFTKDVMPSENLALYAQFTQTAFQATFNVEGKITNKGVMSGALIPKPQDPTKADYVFNGWYTAKTGGDKWDFAKDTMPNKKLTLYAQFSPVKQSLQVTPTTTSTENPSKENSAATGQYSLPKTGDDNHDVCIGILFILSSGGLLLLNRKL
ncbi:TPA_asm: internalin [Listeria monocytogenes]|nr:internalin [Listeria monocytogenes]HAC0982461.1 internalin [Listeria monocytogenes]